MRSIKATAIRAFNGHYYSPFLLFSVCHDTLTRAPFLLYSNSRTYARMTRVRRAVFMPRGHILGKGRDSSGFFVQGWCSVGGLDDYSMTIHRETHATRSLQAKTLNIG